MFDVKAYTDPTDHLDWRWQRVQSLCRADQRPSSKDDRYVWKGWRFLNALHASTSELERYELAQDHRAVSLAFSVYNDPNLRREYFESLSVCTDLTLKDEADYLDVPQSVVTTYEKLFFDVRDRKEKKGFLATKVITPSIIAELHDAKNPIYAWKLIAVYGGSEAVKTCWEFNQGSPEAEEFFRRAGTTHMLKNFAMAQYFRPVDRFTAIDVTDSVMRMLEIEVKREAISGMNSNVQERADVVMEFLSAQQLLLRSPSAELPPAREMRVGEVIKAKAIEADVVAEGK